MGRPSKLVLPDQQTFVAVFEDQTHLPTFFADDLPASENIDNYVLKPLYSFAGHGVDMEPTREKIAALENPREWILQRKIDYAAFVPTVDGQKSKAEIRMMFVWPESDRDPTLVNNLVRMSQGKMMGVDFNVEKTWVGASIALHEAVASGLLSGGDVVGVAICVNQFVLLKPNERPEPPIEELAAIDRRQRNCITSR